MKKPKITFAVGRLYLKKIKIHIPVVLIRLFGTPITYQILAVVKLPTM